MNEEIDIIVVIQEEALQWYMKHGEPPLFAFMHVDTMAAVMREAYMGMGAYLHFDGKQPWNSTLTLCIETPVGSVAILPDNTIDNVNVMFLSRDRSSKYEDYLIETFILDAQ